MKKSVKIMATLLLIAMLVSTFSTVCFATTVGNISFGSGNAADTNGIQGKAENIVATIRNIAAIAGVVIIAILGIKYMLGSVEEKAEYKKSFVPLIIGIVVVVAAAQIASMIFGMAK